MKILLYSGAMDGKKDKLSKHVLKTLPQIDTNSVDSIENLSKTICKPLHGISVAILMPLSPNELEEMLAFKTCFDNIKIIIILPDRKNNCLPTAFKLNPSFISHGDKHFTNITDVLKKIFNFKKTRDLWETQDSL